MSSDLPIWTAAVDDSWRDLAACLGMEVEIFFAERGADAKTKNETAKEVCRSCRVRFDCLHAAMLEPQPWFGVRGGLTAKERRRLEWRPRNR